MIQRIAILGVGLIGGSLGLSWKRYRPDVDIVGYDEPDVLDEAFERGAIDERTTDLRRAVREADLVVLAVPLAPMLRLLDQMAPHLAPDTVVTDVGSVKTPVVERAGAVLPDTVSFVGGHPMAGSEKSGIAHADALLFENATYVVCPNGLSPEELQAEHAALLDLIRATGARVLIVDAARHDRIAATVSHLPQLIAVTLTNLLAVQQEEDDAFLQLAAGGFRDLTRIASSPFAMWRDVLVANNGPILDALGRFAGAIRTLRNRLIEEDIETLHAYFDEARRARERIPRDTKGFLHPLADIYVYAEDRPGELVNITRTLYDAELNVKDIELLKIREGTGGAFRISFSGEPEADRAVEALQEASYHAYRL